MHSALCDFEEGLMRRWGIGLILVLSIFLCFLHSWGEEELQNPRELYDSAMELFHQGQYKEAIENFSKLIHPVSKDPLPSYSRYMIGLCYLKVGRYEEALQQFELYLKAYPEGDCVNRAEEGIQISKEKLKEKASLQSAVSKKVKRRICVQIFDFNGKSLKEVEREIKELKNAGVDTLIVRVFQSKGNRIYKFVTPRHEEGVYFKTEYAPVVDDILGKLGEIAHRNGLDIFAWMTTRYANYGLDGNSEYRCKSYNFETRKLEDGRGFNLFHPDVLKRLEGLYRDLGRYPIDGILFQDDLILKHNEDFSTDANKAFLKEFGYSPHPDLFYIDPYQSGSGKYYVKAYTDLFWSWANWKNRWLMKVVQQLMTAARESNPNLTFSINLYYETVLNTSNSVAWFSQTLYQALGKNFDYYALMAYHRQTMKELNIEEKKAIDLMAEVAQNAVKAVGDPSKVMMKLQIYDWKSQEVIPKKEAEEILTKILNEGQVSLAFVPYIDQFPFHLLKEKWTTTK
jgi:uncharacterized lipoprotein YddW (UPF0748 family)